MWFVTRIITNGMSPTFLTNLIQVSIAVPIYFLLTSLFGYNPILSGLGTWKKEN